MTKRRGVPSARDETTRQQFLAAAASLIEERGIQGQLWRVEEIIDRVPRKVTRGAFTHHWRRKQDFDRDLVAYLLNERRLPTPDHLGAQLLPLAERGEPLSALVREGTAANWHEVRTSRAWRTAISMLALLDHPTIGETVTRELRRSNREYDREFAGLFRYLLLGYGRRMREGLTHEDLAVALGAIIEGLSIRWLTDRKAIRGLAWNGDEGWSVASVAVEAIVERFTEPVQPNRDRHE